MTTNFSSGPIAPSGIEDPDRAERLRNARILKFRIKWTETLAEHARRALKNLTDEGDAGGAEAKPNDSGPDPARLEHVQDEVVRNAENDK